ncbi:MAG: hypothetical protein IJ371_04840 [Clostridia bacterium]|nr:hypothetical protein [Clostridia bacterium]
MFLVKNWEMFYTIARQTGDEDLVDQVSIDVVNKRYLLDINVSDIMTDGYDDEMNEINSVYVSRFVFDLIIEGLNRQGFKQIQYSDI